MSRSTHTRGTLDEIQVGWERVHKSGAARVPHKTAMDEAAAARAIVPRMLTALLVLWDGYPQLRGVINTALSVSHMDLDKPIPVPDPAPGGDADG